jgi:hypothetical protein
MLVAPVHVPDVWFAAVATNQAICDAPVVVVTGSNMFQFGTVPDAAGFVACVVEALT